MKPSEVRALVRPAAPGFDPVRRRLARCHDVAGLRAAARRVLPRAVFDYVDGAADEEVSLAANRRAFREHAFLPRAMRDVAAPSLWTRVLGSDLAAPFGLAPTGYSRMMHPDGEAAVARAAARRNLPYTLSTMGTTSIEDVAAAAHAVGHDEIWYQLYVMRNMAQTREMVERAAASGYRVLTVTVDTTFLGFRTRDEHNGLIIPPQLTARTIASIGSRPAYWVRILRNPAIKFANFPAAPPGESVDFHVGKFSASITWDYLAELRASWPAARPGSPR